VPERVGEYRHTIDTGSSPPVCARVRRLAPDVEAAAKAHFDKWVAAGVARLSDSAWASPLHLVRKPDGSLRPCGDYRLVNIVTKPDRYPTRRTSDMTDELRGKRYFSKLDILSGFNHLLMDERDISKTAVITPFGLYEFLRMPFGLRNAPQTFNRFMSVVLSGLHNCHNFCDDVLIASETRDQHENDLRALLDRLREWGIKLNTAKCEFFQTSLEFVGFHITHDGVNPPANRLAAISEIPLPTDSTALRRFTGMINYFHRFIPNCSSLLAPLTGLVTGGKK